MAIQNASGLAAGLSLDEDLAAITNTVITGLFQLNDTQTAGETPVIEIGGASNYFSLIVDGYASGTIVRASGNAFGWEQLAGTANDFDTWFGLGLSCAGVGSNQLKICYSPAPGVFTEFVRTLGGSGWTPALLKLLYSTIVSRGSFAAMQNIKYGTGAAAMTSAKMCAEMWSKVVENPGDWTPLHEPMITGADVAAQAGDFDVVGTLALIDGYFTGETTGTPPTITVTSATITGDAIAVAGTLTSDTTGQTVNIDFLIGSTVIATVGGVVNGLSWTASADGIAAGTYSLRARINDSNGSGSDLYGTTQLFVGLSGEDQIPHVYPNTGILAVPAIASIPVGSTAVFKAVNQAGTAIPGAVVAVGNQGIATAAAGLTDADGNVTVTGVSQGNTYLVLSVMNLGGAFLNAQVPLTIGAPSVSTVTVTPETVSMFVNQTQQFTSVITGGGATTWTVESGGGSIDSDGLYTAPGTATTAVIRGAKTGELGTYDEATVTVSAQPQQSIGAQFIGTSDLAVAPGQSFSWQIQVQVDGEPVAGAVITPSAVPNDILNITQPLPTNANGTTTITGQVVSDTPVNVDVAVTFAIVVGGLSMHLASTVTVAESPYGYVILRGRSYPRPYEQK